MADYHGSYCVCELQPDAVEARHWAGVMYLRAVEAEKLLDKLKNPSVEFLRSEFSLSSPKDGILGLLLKGITRWFIDSGAENYIEVLLTAAKTDQASDYIITVQKKDGKTPHELRLEAERRLELTDRNYAKNIQDKSLECQRLKRLWQDEQNYTLSVYHAMDDEREELKAKLVQAASGHEIDRQIINTANDEIADLRSKLAIAGDALRDILHGLIGPGDWQTLAKSHEAIAREALAKIKEG